MGYLLLLFVDGCALLMLLPAWLNKVLGRPQPSRRSPEETQRAAWDAPAFGGPGGSNEGPSAGPGDGARGDGGN
jgi:hypothetical protein